MTTLKEKIEELREVAKDKVSFLEIGLWCDKDGKWSAAVGGHGAVALGEWPGDYHTYMLQERWLTDNPFEGFDTPEDAISDLIELVKTQESERR